MKHIKLYEEYEEDHEPTFDEYFSYASESEKEELRSILYGIQHYLFQEPNEELFAYAELVHETYNSLKDLVNIEDLKVLEGYRGPTKDYILNLYKFAFDRYINNDVEYNDNIVTDFIIGDFYNFYDHIQDLLKDIDNFIEIDSHNYYYAKVSSTIYASNPGIIEFKIYNKDDIIKIIELMFHEWIRADLEIELIYSDDKHYYIVEVLIPSIEEHPKKHTIVKAIKKGVPHIYSVLKAKGYDESWLSRNTKADKYKGVIKF